VAFISATPNLISLVNNWVTFVLSNNLKTQLIFRDVAVVKSPGGKKLNAELINQNIPYHKQPTGEVVNLLTMLNKQYNLSLSVIHPYYTLIMNLRH